MWKLTKCDSIQMLVSKSHSPLKRIKTAWRNASFQDWDKGNTRWAWPTFSWAMSIIYCLKELFIDQICNNVNIEIKKLKAREYNLLSKEQDHNDRTRWTEREIGKESSFSQNRKPCRRNEKISKLSFCNHHSNNNGCSNLWVKLRNNSI